MRKTLAFVMLLLLVSGAVSAVSAQPAEKLNKGDVIAGLGGNRPNSGTVEAFQLPNNGSSTPAGIAWDPSGKVWIAESVADSIGRYDPSNGKFDHFPLLTTGGQPYGVIPDPDGNIWFTEYMGDKVGVLYTNGTIIEIPVAQKGSYPYEIIYVNGKVWFNMVGSNAIGVVDPKTLKMEEFVLTKSGYQPVGIAADASGAHIYIAGFGGTGIMEFNTTSKKFTEYTLGLQVCWGIRVLANGTVLITSLYDDAVTMWEPVSKKTITYKLPQYTYPTRMSAGLNNTTYVLSYFGKDMFKLKLSNGQYTQFTPSGAGRLWYPVDERSKMLWISDPAKNGLWSFDANSSTFKFVLSDGKGKNAQPIGVAKGGGTVWVAEYGTGRVSGFDIGSQMFKSYTAPSSSDGPADVAVDSKGDAYVTLAQTNSIGKVDVANGTIKATSLGDQPWKLVASGDSIWIACMKSLVRYWPANNSYKQYIPDYQNPTFIAVDVDKNGDVWLSSRGYAALFKFSPATGNFTMIRTKWINSPPYDIKAMDDGSIWYTQTYYSFGPVGRYYPGNGTIREYFTTKSTSGIAGLAIQKDIVWLTDYSDNAIWRLDSTNVTYERYELPDQGSYPYFITAEGDQAWATGNGVSQLIHATYKVDLGKISGKVVDRSGAPITNAKVKITGKQSFDLSVDSKGEFTVDTLPGGYSIDAKAKGYFNASGSVDVKAFKTSTITLVLELDPASLLGWATGTVKDSANESKLISGARVTVGDRFAKSDTNGNFNVTIPEGTYPITVTNNTYFTWNGTVTIARGKATFTNVSLLKIPEEKVAAPPEMPWGTILIALLAVIIVVILILLYMFYRKNKRKKGVVLPEYKTTPQDQQPPPVPVTSATPYQPPAEQPAQVERPETAPGGQPPPGG
jgi:streptogramin lyase